MYILPNRNMEFKWKSVESRNKKKRGVQTLAKSRCKDVDWWINQWFCLVCNLYQETENFIRKGRFRWL